MLNARSPLSLIRFMQVASITYMELVAPVAAHAGSLP